MLRGLLEPTEFERRLGEIAQVTVDVTPELKVRVTAIAEVDLITEAKKFAEKTGTPIDDAAVRWLETIVRAKAKVA